MGSHDELIVVKSACALAAIGWWPAAAVRRRWLLAVALAVVWLALALRNQKQSRGINIDPFVTLLFHSMKLRRTFVPLDLLIL
jgi:hypothetical protein